MNDSLQTYQDDNLYLNFFNNPRVKTLGFLVDVVNTGKLNRVIVDLLDRFRTLRHEDLYELDFSATKDDAEEAVKNAEIIVNEIGRLILK